MTITIRIIAALLALFAAGASHAQTAPPNYPSRQVRVIVAYPPGGPTDVIARLVAQKLSEHLNGQFYVENLPGAGGAIGAGIAANAAPDGHTLFITTNDFAVGATTSKLSYDPVKNFAPISIVSSSPQVIIANPTLPVKDLQELVALAKAEPGKYSYASMSIGFGLLTTERLFRLGLKADMIRVPFQGAAPLITSTLGGHTPVAFIALPPAAPLIKEGKLRALAITGAKRSPDFPDVPTTTEAGFPGQESELLIGFVAPAGTPKPIIDRLHSEVVRIVALPDVKQKLDTLGFTPVASTPEAYAAQIQFRSRDLGQGRAGPRHEGRVSAYGFGAGQRLGADRFERRPRRRCVGVDLEVDDRGLAGFLRGLEGRGEIRGLLHRRAEAAERAWHRRRSPDSCSSVPTTRSGYSRSWCMRMVP